MAPKQTSRTSRWDRVRGRARLPVALGSAALLVLATVGLVGPATSAAAPAAHRHFTVLVGHNIAAGAKNRPADLMRFLPGSINVHPGDAVTFKGEFHTATALPLGTNVTSWVHHNARRLGQKYFFLSRDDEQGILQFNPRVLYPQACNPATGCSFTGQRLVSTGGLGLVSPAKVTFDVNVPAGRSFWVVCLIHPQMVLRVHVVPQSTAIQTQSQIDRAVHKRVSAATASATALWNRLQKQHSHVVNGKQVVDAFAGFDTRSLQLLGMFPRVVHVKTGGAVMWHFAQVRFEPHSVVFPPNIAQQISTGPPPLCEPNQGKKDVPANKDFTCPTGSHGPVEIELDPRLTMPGGSNTVTSATGYHNSGARGGFDIANHAPYTLHFPVRSPKGGFGYACGVHGKMMSGVVKVG